MSDVYLIIVMIRVEVALIQVMIDRLLIISRQVALRREINSIRVRSIVVLDLSVQLVNIVIKPNVFIAF